MPLHGDYSTLANHIGGRNVPPRDAAAYLDNTDPATGGTIGRIPDSSGADVDDAVRAAGAAFPAWSALSAERRAGILLKLADAIDASLDALARAESVDSGKPITLARNMDIPRAAANFRSFAHAIIPGSSDLHDGLLDTPAGPVRALNYTLRKPRGVAGLISPWNLPLYLLTWKIAPALASGNTAVCKPSEFTPTTASMLADLALDAGLPPGVLNIVHGRGPAAGAALVTHPDVPAISFTGSTAVGKWIAQHAGPMLKRLSLELGGKNPFIVFDDADLDTGGGAIDTAVRAAFTNQGQICLCGSRLLVHRRVYDRVLEGVVERAKRIRVGDPLDPATGHGATVNRAQLDKIASYIQMARDLGGTVHCGGRAADPGELPERCRGGSFFLPTVISGLTCDCRVEQEEIFGPVMTVTPFEDEEEALRLANATPYGLAATLWTRDLSRAHRMADRLETGIVWINCWLLRDLRTPFGGVKMSGVGREGGKYALDFFTEPKNVCIRV